MADDDIKTISLEDHNAKLAETRRKYESKASQAADKAISTLLSDLGYESKDELKEAIAAATAASESTKTDLEKVQSAHEKALAELEAERAKLSETVQRWHTDKIRAEVVAAATKAHAPDQVFALTRSDYEVDEDGTIKTSSGKSVAEHVSAWLNENPHHMLPQSGQGGGSGPSSSQDKGPDLRTPEGRAEALAARGITL